MVANMAEILKDKFEQKLIQSQFTKATTASKAPRPAKAPAPPKSPT
jgi:hypothetical protein